MQDEPAFLKLVREHQRILHKVCNLYEHEPTLREDLFQEIVLQAWHSFAKFRGDAKFSTWLYRVALNTAISFYRKDQKKPELISADILPEYKEHKEDKEEQVQAMYKAISSLSKIDKALVMLYLEDYDYKEIGDALGITANNVAVKMNRIKAKLKTETQKHYEYS